MESRKVSDIKKVSATNLLPSYYTLCTLDQQQQHKISNQRTLFDGIRMFHQSTCHLDRSFSSSGPVLCMAMNPSGEQFYSGGLDSIISVWNIPNADVDPYDAYGNHTPLLLHR